jgi:hypothetical protein
MAAVVLAVAALLIGGALNPASADHSEVTAADGLSFNYLTDVSLFGGPSNLRGYGQTVDNPPSASPSVECPAGGGTDSVTDPDGARAVYGPAVIFGGRNAPENTVDAPSGPLTSSIDCQLGEGGHVTASTSVTLMPPGSTWVTPSGTTQPHLGGVGPGPFIADEVHSTCTANADGTWTASATIVNGTLDTRYDAETQEPVATEFVPTNPGANYTREGTIDHVGDSYRIVFNEQSVNADGSVTVNAAHMYLLGPTAVGDMVIGSSTCGPLTTAALNHPPVAVDDAYATDFETALNVAAPGVLANDTDADGDALTAGMPTEPANGTLVLNADGSFTYTPDAGFSGNDTFTYMAHDPDGGMDTATVTITVRPATPEECKPGWGHGDKRHCHSGPPRGRVSAGIAPSLSALGQGLAAMVKVMARLW